MGVILISNISSVLIQDALNYLQLFQVTLARRCRATPATAPRPLSDPSQNLRAEIGAIPTVQPTLAGVRFTICLSPAEAVLHRSEQCEIRAGFAGREFLLNGTDIDLDRHPSTGMTDNSQESADMCEPIC